MKYLAYILVFAGLIQSSGSYAQSDDDGGSAFTGITLGVHMEKGSFSATSPGYRDDSYKMRNIGTFSYQTWSRDIYMVMDISIFTSHLIYGAFNSTSHGGYAKESDREIFNHTRMRLLFAGPVANLGKNSTLLLGGDIHWYKFGLQNSSDLSYAFKGSHGPGPDPIFNNGVLEETSKFALGMNVHTMTDLGFGLLRCSFMPSVNVFTQKGFILNPEISFTTTRILLNPYVTFGYSFRRFRKEEADPFDYPAANVSSLYMGFGLNIGGGQ